MLGVYQGCPNITGTSTHQCLNQLSVSGLDPQEWTSVICDLTVIWDSLIGYICWVNFRSVFSHLWCCKNQTGLVEIQTAVICRKWSVIETDEPMKDWSTITINLKMAGKLDLMQQCHLFLVWLSNFSYSKMNLWSFKSGSFYRHFMNKWVIKFNSLLETRDIGVHVVHASRVIITYTLESLSSLP